MHLLYALEQGAINGATDYFCCPILEQKRWTAEKGTCWHVWFSHSVRGTFGKQFPLYKQRCFASPFGKGIALLWPPKAVFLQLHTPFCPGRLVRGAGEMVICGCVSWHLWPKHVAREAQGLGCPSINLHISPQHGPPTWNIHAVLFPNHLTEVITALFFSSYFILPFSHPQWILVWALSWTEQLAGETLLLELRTGWLQKLLPVMKIQMLRMITE